MSLTMNQWTGYPFRSTVRPSDLVSREKLQELWDRINAELTRRRAGENATQQLTLTIDERTLLAELLDCFLRELKADGDLEFASNEFRVVMGVPIEDGEALRDRLREPAR